MDDNKWWNWYLEKCKREGRPVPGQIVTFTPYPRQHVINDYTVVKFPAINPEDNDNVNN